MSINNIGSYENVVKHQISNGHDHAINHHTSATTVLQLKSTDTYSRKLFLKFVQRAIEFIGRYNSDTDPIWLMQLLASNFYQGTNLIHLLVAIDAKGEIVAHNLTYVESRHMLGNVAVLLQLEKDIKDDSSITDLGMELVKTWARSLGIKTILNESATRSRARLWRKYNFREYRITSRLDLE